MESVTPSGFDAWALHTRIPVALECLDSPCPRAFSGIHRIHGIPGVHKLLLLTTHPVALIVGLHVLILVAP